ncbi:MAG: phosphomannomutase/phosphoglucomutase [Dehalococcoidales bacterium]|nr:phosphomannomutase/phosphoglucomutase [Dehalococcoidales bacterium]
MIINPQIFRMYDIRGEVGSEINDEFAHLLGKAFGTYLKSIAGPTRWVVVGRDNRHSSESLHFALCQGLISTGCHVIDIGLSPSPVMNFAVVNWGFSGGINVTGSHTPPNKNGFKLVGPKAYPVAENDVRQLLPIIEKQDFITGNGLLATMQPKEAYIARLISLVSLKRPLTVVIDSGNGVAGLLAPELLKGIGCDVIELYCKDDGDYPNHFPNPENVDTLQILRKVVVNCGADIGLAFDGDGDRLGVVTENGNLCSSEQVLILLSRGLLARHPGEKVILDIKSSQIAIDEICRLGGEPVMWKTGHSLIKRKMHQEGILLAGEASGHYFPAEDYYPIDDALLAGCRLLEYLSGQTASLAGLLASLKTREQESFEVPCPDTEQSMVVAAVQEYFKQIYSVIDIDGARIQIDGGWALVRASNTSAALSVKFEADNLKKLAGIKQEVLAFLKNYPQVELSELLN